MERSSSILVGVDFSESADRALGLAVLLAERLSARLDLVYVYDVPVVAMPELVMPSTNDNPPMAEFRQQLKELRSRVVGDRVPTRIHLLYGDAVAGMLDLIKELQPEMVVVGSHGRGAVMRALMGSVSERLSRRSPVPVLIVPAPARAATVQKLAHEEDHRLRAEPQDIASSCTRCGHILRRPETSDRCTRCGLEPASWTSVAVSHKPADELERAVGEGVGENVSDQQQSGAPAALFATSPPGAAGPYSANPELRIRY